MTDVAGAESSDSISRHAEFYLEDGNVVFRVENVLFNVHRYFFTRDSLVFKCMFALPPPDGRKEGASDEDPIHLPGVKVADMECLLRLMYPQKLGSVSLRTTDEWVSVLELATRFEFSDARELAIATLGPLCKDPVTKIALAQRFDVRREWIVSAFVEMVMRDSPITLGEGAAMGIELTVQLASARELLRANRELACRTCQHVNVQLYCDVCQDYTELPFHLLAPKDVTIVAKEALGLGKTRTSELE